MRATLVALGAFLALGLGLAGCPSPGAPRPGSSTAAAESTAMCPGAAELRCLTKKICTWDRGRLCNSCACEPAWDPKHAPDPGRP